MLHKRFNGEIEKKKKWSFHEISLFASKLYVYVDNWTKNNVCPFIVLRFSKILTPEFEIRMVIGMIL